NFDYRSRGEELWRELRQRDFTDDIAWFFQARTDDIANNPDLVAKLREVGNSWILIGVESNSPEVLKDFKKGLRVGDAARAVKVLNDNDVFTQSMLVMGSRRDTAESIKQLRRFSLELDTHLAIYTVLTPYPGTEVHETALRNGWIEDSNYAHYDMVHAIMPTESLSRDEVQQELYGCYRAFYGSLPRNIAGLFSKNKLKRRAYRHMAGKSVLRNLRRLI
ncbi:MAG: cobalamin-binding protein, partial [Thermoplasmata archaeon]|nr:cobalamin-binding protein [Thermoplasmata archaeon]